MGQIYCFEYTHRRYNEEEQEMEYLVDGEWRTKSDLKETANEIAYWIKWADDINPNDG